MRYSTWIALALLGLAAAANIGVVVVSGAGPARITLAPRLVDVYRDSAIRRALRARPSGMNLDGYDLTKESGSVER